MVNTDAVLFYLIYVIFLSGTTIDQ